MKSPTLKGSSPLGLKSNPELRKALDKIAIERNAFQSSVAESRIDTSSKSFLSQDSSVVKTLSDIDELVGLDSTDYLSAKDPLNKEEVEAGKVGYEDIEEIDMRAVLEIKDDESYSATLSIMRSQKLIARLEQALISLLAIRNENKDKILPQINEAIKKVEQKINEVESAMLERAMSSSEAYTMYHSIQLVSFQKQMTSGKIVETESVHRNVLKIQEAILEGKPVLLQGPPGTGKTEVAKHAAEKIKRDRLEKEFPKIKKTGEVDIEDFLKLVDERKNNIKEASEASPTYYIVSGSKDFHYSEMAGTGGVRASGDTGAMETYFNYGPLYKAMEQGVPMIVDEANLIPPGIILKLNEYMTRRAGETIRVQENGGKEIVIKKGFSIIYTGNVGAQFQDRFKIEASQRDRMGLILDYDYVPNCSDPDAKREVVENGETKTNAAKSELWHIVLSHFMDKKARMQLPAGDEDQLWQFSKAVRYAQDVYAGRIDIKLPSASGGPSATSAAAAIKEYQLSMRSVFNILDEYKKDTSLPIGYYIAQKFLTEKLENNKNAVAVYSKIFKDFGLLTKELEGMLNVTDPDDKENIKTSQRRCIENKNALETKTFSSRDTVTLAFGVDANFETDSALDNYEKRYNELLTPEDKEKLRQEQEKLDLENAKKAQAEMLNRLEVLKKANQEALESSVKKLEINNKKLEDSKTELEGSKKILRANPNQVAITNIEVTVLASKKLIDKIKSETQSQTSPFDFSDQEKVDKVMAEIGEKIKKQEDLMKSLSPITLPSPELISRLKQASLLDSTFNNLDFHPLPLLPLTEEQAHAKYLSGPDSPSISGDNKKFTYLTPEKKDLNVFMLQFDEVTLQSSDAIVAKMLEHGMRPMNHEELIQFCTLNPEFQKKNYLVALGTKQMLGADVCVSSAFRNGSYRYLHANIWDSGWYSDYRFPAVAISA